jgi:hypothetical protein
MENTIQLLMHAQKLEVFVAQSNKSQHFSVKTCVKDG